MFVIGPEWARTKHDPALFQIDLELQVLLDVLHHGSHAVCGGGEHDKQLHLQHALRRFQNIILRYYWSCHVGLPSKCFANGFKIEPWQPPEYL